MNTLNIIKVKNKAKYHNYDFKRESTTPGCEMRILAVGKRDVNEAFFSQPYIKPRLIGLVLGRSSLTTLTKLMEEMVAAKL